MKWFLDTEFDDNGKTIELISIALVSDEGREYYAVSSEFDPGRCNDWVKANVLPNLGTEDRHSRARIAADISDLLLPGEPEIWGYYADYDWVAFCQLFGSMMDLPDGMPMFCNDLMQEIQMMEINSDSLPLDKNEHNALTDARWMRAVMEVIKC